MSQVSGDVPATAYDRFRAIEELICELQERCAELEIENRELRDVLLAPNGSQGRSQQDLLGEVFDVAPVGHCILDAGGRIMAANPVAASLLGLTPGECLGRAFSDFVAEASAGSLEQQLGDVVKAQKSVRQSTELRLRKQDGSTFPARLVSSALSGAAEEPRCLLTLLDLTELFVVQESEARFRRIAAHVEDVYYQTDTSGRTVHVSLAYERVWGRKGLEGLGKSWFQSVHADDLPQVKEAWRLLLKGDPFDEEYRIVRPDGEIRWVRDRAFVIERPTLQIVGVARDVTDDRELEEELRQAQKLEALGTLASSVAHDFGNLLQGVMGCLNIALSDATPVDRARDFTRQALMAVRGGATLVGQLMKFGRKERARPRAIGIDAAISGCAKLLQRLLGDHIQLHIEADAPRSMILADPVQVEQILMNLAANARDAMPGGGRLLIKTSEARQDAGPYCAEGPAVRLEVRDIGCGMDSETRAHVFEPFFTTKAAGKGTGLGLSAVRAVTRALGGQVELESEVGKGTAFVFHFPAVAGAPSGQPRAVEGVQFAGRALLVEDDWRVRISVRQYLEELGFEVVEASDAMEALSRAKGTLALLVTDVVLPEVSGPRIRELLHDQYPDLKALYISAHPAPYLMEHGLLQKSDMILQKPFELQDLAFRLGELCSDTRPAGPSHSSRGMLEMQMPH